MKCIFYIALSTLPDRKHRVQTLIVLGAPFTRALTVLILARQLLRLCLLEWLILLPEITPFPHTSHCLICAHLLRLNNYQIKHYNSTIYIIQLTIIQKQII